ncbi:hypothetical protein BH11BAC2_BH11BAC2_22550 [soil metagenome]
MKNIFNQDDYKTITARIKSLTPVSERVWGTMNVQETIVHCTEPVREALGIRKTKDLSNWFYRSIGKYIVLYVLPWPKGKLPTSPYYDVKKKGTTISNFEDDKDVLLKMLSNFYTTTSGFEFSPHPLLGKLNHHQWGRMTWLHLDHHLRQFGV